MGSLKVKLSAVVVLFIVFAFTLNVNNPLPKQKRPNILLITVDDMNWNSVGVFGNDIKNITPNIDQLAKEGTRFERAYVAASNCSPSRSAIQTGLYPQQSGVRGFYYVNDKRFETISTLLKKEGYFTGITNKAGDTNPSPNKKKYWDVISGFKKIDKYASQKYAARSNAFYKEAKASGKPFYYVVNIADPHKPFFNDPKAQKNGLDVNEPSRIIDENEIKVPSFLPDIPGVRNDLRNYYNSVKRADDCVGALLKSLKAAGLDKNTMVVFLSDHGMPFPFAKSSVYDNGLRTPLIFKWKNEIKAGGVINNQLVSTLDLMPTFAEVAGAKMPKNAMYTGASLVNSFKKASAQGKPYVFGNFDENSKGTPRPMRGAISKKWNYVFNAWATGDYKFQSASMYHQSYKSMKRKAKSDAQVASRLKMINKRTVEELYDLEADPDCLVNLADDPKYAKALKEMRTALGKHLKQTNDYVLEAFEVKNDKAKLNKFMEKQIEEAKQRAEQLKWKRSSNIAGPTKANQLLYSPQK